MEYKEIKAIIESLLFASGDEGVKVRQLSHVLEVESEMIQHLLEELKFDYDNKQSGIMLAESQETYFLTTKPEYSPYVQKLLNTPHTSKLSQASLETLAIIAYGQPITRTEIEHIRGVNSDRAVQTLAARSLVEEVGRKEGAGRPVLFGTSKTFLTYFGLSTLEELPELPSEVDVQDITEEADLFFDAFNDETE
ncbi:Segregation and condensation protein [Lentibacillus sp. JNUCC-1]|uniref:SMC-Scp complex subunit ScpB n=1 Tax=Lentibacillus sp. JNUCC-1 TaxID=2654513 RepID=UPI001322A2D6|nr:Segregation and condensation protein [Lentibacillus sp. JNUCC-1]